MDSNVKNQNSLGLLGSVATIVGTVMGASIFILLGPIASKTGPALYLAYFLAFFPALFSGIYYAQLGAVMPNTGGSYFYTSRLISPFFGFIVAWSIIFAGIGAISMLSIGFAEYLKFYFPSLPVIYTALFIIITLFILNLFGLKSAVQLQVGMMIWMILALLVFAIPGLFFLKDFSGQSFLPNGIGGLAFGSALAFYSYTGIGIISELGGDIKDPKRNVPRAICWSLIIILFVYLLVTYVSTGVISWEKLSVSSASVPEAAATFLPNWAIIFIGTGAMMATITTINAIMMAIPREFIALAKDGLIKESWIKMNKHEIPTLSLTSISLAALIGVITGLKVDYFATITVVGLLFGTVVVGIAAWKLPKADKKTYEQASFKIPVVWLKVSSFLGIVSSIVFIFLALLDVPTIALVFMLWFIIGYIAVRSRMKKVDFSKKKGKDAVQI